MAGVWKYFFNQQKLLHIRGLMTAEKLDPQKETTSYEDITFSNMIQHEALIRLLLLLKKGIIDRDEYLGEVKAVSRELMDRQAK